MTRLRPPFALAFATALLLAGPPAAVAAPSGPNPSALAAPPAGAAGPKALAAPPAGAVGPSALAPPSTPAAGALARPPWEDLAPAAFARARAEKKLVLLDGAAEWCHWCHVMDATTYADPRVRALLAARFVVTRVDVDARPDVEERYGAWGWPATVLFRADGEEIGKYKGYLAPDDLLAVLQAATEGAATAATTTPGTGGAVAAPPTPVAEETLALAYDFVRAEIDEYWDDAEAGWGRTQKAQVATNNLWTLAQARAGDGARKAQAVLVLDRQRKLLDPVWGGMFQYSAAADWEHPHYEKLMAFQAGAIESYAVAYAVTKEPRFLADAQSVRRYVDSFLTSRDGGFYASQDADLGPGKPGSAFYGLSDTARRRLGAPRVDTHEYTRENGLAIAAYVALYEASGDASALASATRAALRIEATHAVARGGFTHDAAGPGDGGVLYLADNAAFLWALVRLHEATRDPAWLAKAVRLADVLVRDLGDTAGGGFLARTPDPAAVGVFRARRRPFEDNVLALRALAHLVRLRPDAGHTRALRLGLRPLVQAEAVKARGRWLGDLLLLLEESRGLR